MRRGWPVIAVVLAVALGAAPAAHARAADSLAPAGAPHNWLPKEGWVWMHWLPFDERALQRTLGVGGPRVMAWLSDDRHTLAALARRRGHRDPRRLARQLTRHWEGRVAPRRLRDLRWRAMRMLTQGHLAQHVLFHVFHGPGIPAHAPEIFGVTREAFIAARQEGRTPAELAAAAGRPLADVRARIVALLRAESARGVATRSQTRAQAGVMLGRQLAALDCWLTRPLPKLDPSNAYGGRDGGPGMAPEGATEPAIHGCH